jgi:hypothetical protein
MFAFLRITAELGHSAMSGRCQQQSLVFAPWAARLHNYADQKVLICDGPRPPTKPDAEKRFFLSPPKSSYILGMEVGVRW